MENIYIVHWGKATQDDRGNASAYSGVHGVYKTLDEAQVGLMECEKDFSTEIIQEVDDMSVYGSVSENYFEIDYSDDGIPCEIYIAISEQKLN